LALSEIAYAKLNLALHVRRRCEDGYHAIETLFAFVDAGDTLRVEVGGRDTLITVGEFASQLADPFGNIVAKALTALPRAEGWKVLLEKALPVAAGLGGGSADAGAVFRLIQQRFGLPSDWHERARRLGADVPACVASAACIGHGAGDDLSPVDNDLAGTPVLLVNPRLPLPTGPVFAGWDGVDRGSLPQGPASVVARLGRNDLEPSAIALCPPIADVLAALRSTGAWLTRMSGSGATCFALYASADERDAARGEVARSRPDWWTMTGALRA
jgi:4-diphosphocytidyl-2-C-methyl-D-erythritol kinase